MADIQRIVIELAADTTEMQPAFDQLEALGKIDQETAKAFRATNQAISERNKTLGYVANQQKQVTESSKQTAKEYDKLAQSFAKASQTIANGASKEVIEGFFEGMEDALKEAGLSVDQFAQKVGQGLGASSPVTSAGNSTKSLRAELRSLKQELATLDPSDARFGELAAQAGELEDRIGDVNLEIRNLASDTAALDGTIQGIQGVAGAFQVAQGSAALFGVESSELQQTLVRLTALLNITNGLQQIQNLLQRQSAASLLITNAQRRISTALIALEGAAESRNVVIRGAAIVAQRTLNAVMRANPAGILITAVAALAGALLILTRNTDSAREAQDRLNKSQLEELKLLQSLEAGFNQVSNDKIRSLNFELDTRKAAGASAVELAKIEKQIADQKLVQALQTRALYQGEIQNIGLLIDKQQELAVAISAARSADSPDEKKIESLQTELDLITEQIDTINRLKDTVIAARSEQIRATTAIQTAEKAAADERRKEADERAEEQRQRNLQKLEDEKAFIQTSLNEVKAGSQEETALRLALVQKEAEIALASLTGTKNTEAQRLLIISDASKQASEIRTNAEIETINKLFDAQSKLGQVDLSNIQARLTVVKKGSDEELQLKKDLIEAQADQDKLAAQQTFTLSEKTVEDKKLFDAQIIEIDAQTQEAKIEAEKEYYDEKERLRQQDLEEQEKVNQLLLDGTLQVFRAVGDAFFAGEQRRIKDAEQLQLSELNKRKDAELNNKRLTDKQKVELEERYRKQEAAIKLKAWEAEQDAKLSQAIMNTALAVTAALATGPPQGYILAALSAALGLVEITAIASEKPPKFATGTEFVKGPGTETSDSIAAYLSKGERVFSAKKNRDYWPILSAIHNDKISPVLANSLVDISAVGPGMKPISEAMSSQFSGLDIDYNKMGRSIADHLMGEFDYLTESVKQSGEMQASLLSTLNTSMKRSTPVSKRAR